MQAFGNAFYAPCTCGELFQGTLDGEPCLISCPVDVWSVARLAVSPSVRQSNQRKVAQALTGLPRPLPHNVHVVLRDPLPPGRGYGTSTADIGAALYAAADFLRISLNPQEAAKIAVMVEPTDSSLFEKLTLFAHRSGAFYIELGMVDAHVVILDAGGTVDTETFNAQDWRPQLRKLAADHVQALELIRSGLSNHDLAAVGEASSMSARLHQSILFNPLLPLAEKLGREMGASGVVRAHSGTLVGLLFAPERYDGASLRRHLRHRLPRDVMLRFTRLVSGGVRKMSPEILPSGARECQPEP
ncbi:MAG: hypothetical protein HPY45_10720 [Anaerolineae bacterium]|nr:hypothetical protein [Anaerolineae bacterium]